jgi:hypothetical protein
MLNDKPNPLNRPVEDARSCPTHGHNFIHTRAGGHCTKCSWRPVVSPRAASVPPPAPQFPAPEGKSAPPAVAVPMAPKRDARAVVAADQRIIRRWATSYQLFVFGLAFARGMAS